MQKLSGVERSEFGKGFARKLRKLEMIPAVVYSYGRDTISFSTNPKNVSKILLSSKRRNSLIILELINLTGKKQIKNVMVYDLQIDSITRTLLHVDFLEININIPIFVMVPVIVSGKCKAVVSGGYLIQIRNKIKLKCMPSIIPEKIIIDVTKLPFGTIRNSDIILPENVELADNAKYVVISVKPPRGIKEEK